MYKFLGLLFLAVLNHSCNNRASEKISFANATAPKKGFAIVELFTSEGCSSCPPADKLAAALAAKAIEQNENVFVLSEHVDYWNKIGWTDPFSNKMFTQRQNWYAGLLKDDGVYTPQMIVNGKTAFVGSDRKAALASIKSALAASSGSGNIHITEPNARANKYAYKLEKVIAGEVLNFVLVQKHATSKVLRGENEGRILEHDNVAREWITLESPSPEGIFEFKNMVLANDNENSVVAFTQNTKTGQITSAGIFNNLISN